MKDEHAHYIPLVTLQITVFVWAANSLFAKLIPLPAENIIYLRSFPALAALTLALILMRVSFLLSARDWLIGIGIGALTAAHWVTFYQSVQASSVAVGMITLYTYPLLTAIAEPLIHKQKPRLSQLVLALVGLSGVGFIALGSFNGSISIAAIGLGLTSSLVFTVRNLSSKILMSHVPSLMQMWLQVLVTLLLLAALLGIEPIVTTSLDNWSTLSLLGVFFVALPHTMFLFALKHIDAAKASLMSMIQPLYAILLAFFVLSEVPTIYEVIGGSIILGTAAWATTQSVRSSRN